MCDRHKGKNLTHYCLEHDEIICSQCATEEHTQTPCESVHLTEAAQHIAPKLELSVSELKKLKGISQSVLDGRREDDTIQTVNEVEAMIDKFVEEMRRKINKAKASLRQFSELSPEEHWKLKAVASKKIPNGTIRSDTKDAEEVRDMVTRLREVRKQTKIAEKALNALPNYVEVSVNQEFLESLAFDGNPIDIKRNVRSEVNDTVNAEFDDSLITSLLPDQETVYLIEKSTFSLEHCSDIVIMTDYIVASVGDSVQKRDRKRMSFRQGLTIKGANVLSRIGESTKVAVMPKSGRISVIETMPSLKILYSLIMTNPYVDISYIEYATGFRGFPEQSPIFVVCYGDDEKYKTEYVDLIQAKPTRYPGTPPKFLIEARTIADSRNGRNKSRFHGITSVSSFQNSDILVGASKGVTCLSKSGILIWSIDLFKQITTVMAYRTLIFAIVKDERKIVTIGNQGHVISENILPPMDLLPEKICVFEDVLMVKQTGQFKWIIFRKMYDQNESND